MQAARSSDQQPTRTVGIGELKSQADEIVREVSETGRPIDIVQNGQVAARLSPAPATEPASADAASAQEREHAVRDWLRRMDDVSQEIAAVWPTGISAQDVIDDVRGPW
jgi:antitoxin (DNA-binding transcriptional repressor) of toxin-antitoxin stability system